MINKLAFKRGVVRYLAVTLSFLIILPLQLGSVPVSTNDVNNQADIESYPTPERIRLIADGGGAPTNTPTNSPTPYNPSQTYTPTYTGTPTPCNPQGNTCTPTATYTATITPIPTYAPSFSDCWFGCMENNWDNPWDIALEVALGCLGGINQFVTGQCPNFNFTTLKNCLKGVGVYQLFQHELLELVAESCSCAAGCYFN